MQLNILQYWRMVNTISKGKMQQWLLAIQKYSKCLISRIAIKKKPDQTIENNEY